MIGIFDLDDVVWAAVFGSQHGAKTVSECHSRVFVFLIVLIFLATEIFYNMNFHECSCSVAEFHTGVLWSLRVWISFHVSNVHVPQYLWNDK